MSSVVMSAPVQPTAVAQAPAPATSSNLPQANQSLLPEPDEGASLDAMSEIYAVMSAMRRTTAAADKGNAEGRLEQKRLHREQALKAIKKAEDDKDEAGFFGGIAKKFGTAGKIAAVAGAVALVVGTGGAGVGVLAIAAVVLSSAAFVQSETKVLQKLGMDDKTASYTELGLLGASAACSGGAAIAAAGSAGATAAGTAAETASEFDKAAQMVGAGASIVSGACATTSAYAGWRRGEYEADAEDRMADASGEQAKAAQMQRLLMQVIDAMEDSEKSDQRTLGHLRGAIEAKGTALTMASARV